MRKMIQHNKTVQAVVAVLSASVEAGVYVPDPKMPDWWNKKQKKEWDIADRAAKNLRNTTFSNTTAATVGTGCPSNKWVAGAEYVAGSLVDERCVKENADLEMQIYRCCCVLQPSWV